MVHNKRSQFSSYFRNYCIQWVDAKKVNNAGRARGGCLYGFKKVIQNKFNLKFINIQDEIILSANFNGNKVHFIPKYLSCTDWKNEAEKFRTFLQNVNPTNFCIIGDFNARIGEEQILERNLLRDFPNFNSKRNSKDKTINSQGRKLLNIIEDIGGIVLNGRTTGDDFGDFSFCGVMGSSVIDYCFVSSNFLTYVNKFQIASEPFSDHMPLCLEMKISSVRLNIDTQNGLDRLYWKNSHCQSYQENLSNRLCNTSILNEISVDEMVNVVIANIKSANVKMPKKKYFVPRQKWFDWRCYRFRTVMRKHLKEYRSNHSIENRHRYYSSRVNFQNVCKQNKMKYHNNNLRKLQYVTCSKDWWQLSNSLKDRSISDIGDLRADDFVKHFSVLLLDSHDQKISWCMPPWFDPFLDSPFEFCDLNTVLKKLKLSKSPGDDGIPYEFYKYGPPCLHNYMLSLYNYIFLHEDIPSSFKRSILIPLHKKGDKNVVTNYRGLSLINTLCKVFCNIILNRLIHWVSRNNILNEFQAGFRKEYSTVDNIFNLTNIVSLNNQTYKHTYAFFVDFSSAFDLIPRNSLFYKLSTMGLSSKILRILQAMYECSVSRVWDGNTYSSFFPVDSGVKQGCILSPMLFSLYLNDLHDILPGGLYVANTNIKILLYADDIVILSNTPQGLQEMIDVLCDYCLMWSLKVNLAKSKIVVFRKGPRISRDLNWHFDNQDIEIVNNYKYLGVDLSYNLSFNKHIKNKLSASKIAINSTWSKYLSNKEISRKSKLKIFDACSKSIMLYAAQVWGYKRNDDMEKLFRFFIKRVLFLPENTPNYLLYIETGWNTLYVTSLKLHFSYVNKILRLNPLRLPRILAEEILRRDISWVKDWSNLCLSLNYSPPAINVPMCHFWKEILSALVAKERQTFFTEASFSQHHDLYAHLQYDRISSLTDKLSARAASLVIKARGGLLKLNASCFRNTDTICSMCNLNVEENTFHFIGICPIYNQYRMAYFGKVCLTLSEVCMILNGSNFESLYKYLEICIRYRNLILNEFNY